MKTFNLKQPFSRLPISQRVEMITPTLLKAFWKSVPRTNDVFSYLTFAILTFQESCIKVLDQACTTFLLVWATFTREVIAGHMHFYQNKTPINCKFVVQNLCCFGQCFGNLFQQLGEDQKKKGLRCKSELILGNPNTRGFWFRFEIRFLFATKW